MSEQDQAAAGSGQDIRSQMTPMRRGSVSLSAVRQALTAREKSMGAKVLTLVISLLIFAGAGLLNNNPVNLALIVLVLLIHEAGHWIGMKLFKYNDVQMFFIPGFGAAVSGNERTPCARQKAVVALLGPVPGIVLGIACVVVYAFTRSPLLVTAAAMFLLINGFNLLPITPFDGGRFLEAILFTRHPRAEAGFKLAAAIALGFLAYQLKSVALGIVAYISIVSIKYVWGLAQSSQALRRELPEDQVMGDDIPDEWLLKLISSLDGTLSDLQKKPKVYANAARTIWNRMRIRHCSAGAAVGLVIVYLLSLSPFVGLMVVSGMVARQEVRSTDSSERDPAAADELVDGQDGAFHVVNYTN